MVESVEAKLATLEYIPHVSPERCEEFTRRALQDIEEHKALIPTANGLQLAVFGWDSALVAPGDASSANSPRFVFTKHFTPGNSAAQLAEQTLKMWTPSDPMHAHLFPVYAHSELRLLQQIDARTFVLLQTLAVSDRGVASASTDDTSEHEPDVTELQSRLLLSDVPLATASLGSDDSASGSDTVRQKVMRAVLHVVLVEHSVSEWVFVVRSIPSVHYELSRSNTGLDDEWIDFFNWYGRRRFRFDATDYER